MNSTVNKVGMKNEYLAIVDFDSFCLPAANKFWIRFGFVDPHRIKEMAFGPNFYAVMVGHYLDQVVCPVVSVGMRILRLL
mmetsp:Transcript_9051/g.14006  ORF Transcript_9051/g.14006 Transcript_9051/m.14006 type:complete len:80 (+) Transcript_9051:998-1237(+)